MDETRLIRVSDGSNFDKLVYPFWGFKPNKNNLGYVKKIPINSTIWFITNQSSGSKLIGFARYIGYSDNINNYLWDERDQGWMGNDWDLQIHFRNLYILRDLSISWTINGTASVLTYRNHNYFLVIFAIT